MYRRQSVSLPYTSILSRPELRPEPVEGRSGGRIEGCGLAPNRCQNRPFDTRFTLFRATQDASGLVSSQV
jgi:hypothetical protein